VAGEGDGRLRWSLDYITTTLVDIADCICSLLVLAGTSQKEGLAKVVGAVRGRSV
jgi:hypothetical protein